jgi:GNAT superfamily N-acetyltransferase
VDQLVIEQVTSRTAADQWQRLAQACRENDNEDLPADTPQEIYARVETGRIDNLFELWLGCVDGTPVVLSELKLPLLDNLSNAVCVIATHPAFRRRGYGTAMLEHVISRATLHGRSRLISEISEPLVPLDPATPVPGVALATLVGARAVTSEVRRALKIDKLDDDELARLRDDAVAHSEGYSLIQWDGSAPTEILEDLATLLARMTLDAPLEELDWEPELWTPQRYREQEERIVAGGQRRLSTAARHDESGQIVAMTDIGIALGRPEIADQWATIVLPAHRGHRLGMRVKLANLEFLRRSRPQVTLINTWNAAINDHMVSINEAMGFRAVDLWREWQLELGSISTV